jgi:hypothetical protein
MATIHANAKILLLIAGLPLSIYATRLGAVPEKSGFPGR